MKTQPRHRSLALAILALWLVSAVSTAETPRVVAVGDIHGSLDSLVRILRSAGLIDGDDQWVGGDAVLVQTGDLVDRGAQVRDVLDLMMRLETQAAAAGGQVVALLGNHEVNNLVAYYGDESNSDRADAAIFSHFADEESADRHKRGVADWKRWRRLYPNCTAASKSAWLEAHPEGYLEYAAALGPDGHYGSWLRKRPVVARIGDTIFLHGGLAPEPPAPWNAKTIEAVNLQVAAEIEQFDADKQALVDAGVALPFSELGELLCALDRELVSPRQPGTARTKRLQEIRDRFPGASRWLAFHGDGPLWFRGYANWSDDEGAKQVDSLVETYGAKRFVVGHTPQTVGIVSRFEDRVFLIDTAMVFGAAAGGRPAALEIDGTLARALYESEPAEEPKPTAGASDVAPTAAKWVGPDGEPLQFADDQAVLAFLRQAEVASVEDIPLGVSKPKRLMLEQGTVRSKAVFRYQNVTAERRRLSSGGFAMYFRDSFINEVAAYELGKLLGLDNIPPVVERTIDDQPGSVQMWVENAMMEGKRKKDGIKAPDSTRFRRQFYEMRAFDNLINNTDRNEGNILFDSNWKLWMIDHTRAFARVTDLPSPDEVLGCSRSFFDRLEALDEGTVEEALGQYLSKLEIAALLERREQLVDLLEKRIAAKGEEKVLFNYGDPDAGLKISYEEIAVPEG